MKKNHKKNSPIKGLCEEMCPKDERTFREREGLVHRFEQQKGSNRKKLDPKKAVKLYQRSAAGRNMSNPKHLRTLPCLQATVNYLLKDVAADPRNKDCWDQVYEFVSDRLRSVYSDLVVQELNCVPAAASCLAAMVRFHVYSGYRLCESPGFSQVLNSRLLDQYLLDVLELPQPHPEMEALALVHWLGNWDTLLRFLPPSRQAEPAVALNFALMAGNYARAVRILQKLPLLCRCAIQPHLPDLQRRGLALLGRAYLAPKQTLTTLPEKLALSSLPFNDLSHLEEACRSYQPPGGHPALSVSYRLCVTIKHPMRKVSWLHDEKVDLATLLTTGLS